MLLTEIRTAIITAVASDQELMERLVLKGGNALEIAHGIGGRASLDVDYSMEDEFTDLAAAGEKLKTALEHRFDARGLIVFDFTFVPRPRNRAPGNTWGGYRAEFKLIERKLADKLGHDLTKMQTQAQTIAERGDHRKFQVEISGHEYVAGAEIREIDSYEVRVYTAPMIALEKLRALCQQLAGDRHRANPAPRPRDFYDIHAVVEAKQLDLTTPENLKLARSIFAAKDVAIDCLGRLREGRDFHGAEWAQVRAGVARELKEYEFYFDYVDGLARRVLDALRVVQPPA